MENNTFRTTIGLNSNLHLKVNLSHMFRIILIFLIAEFCSCKKLVDAKAPVATVSGSSVFLQDATAAAVVTSIYASLSGDLAIRSISYRAGLSADELTLDWIQNISLVRFYKNNLNTDQRLTFWETFYNFLNTTNTALEGISSSTSLTPIVKQQLMGECKYLRAFLNFYLLNFFGDIPLVITSDYRTNATINRSAKSDVYSQIVSDLKDAQNLLGVTYVAADAKTVTPERVRPNKWVATALLARVYLYTGNYALAEAESTSIIENTNMYDTVSLQKVFLKNSKEAIWQLQPVNSGSNTEEAKVFILNSTPNASKPAYLSSFVLNAFELGDLRKNTWVSSYTNGTTTYFFPYKYKVLTTPVTEYSMVLRLAEQYLIRSEARAQQNKIIEAQNDLNVIRIRAGLTNSKANDKDSIIEALLRERQAELFTEWGHRWLDLKRTNNIDVVMNDVAALKGGTWNSNWAFYPLPSYDIQQNPNLIQNNGY